MRYCALNAVLRAQYRYAQYGYHQSAFKKSAAQERRWRRLPRSDASSSSGSKRDTRTTPTTGAPDAPPMRRDCFPKRLANRMSAPTRAEQPLGKIRAAGESVRFLQEVQLHDRRSETCSEAP